MRGYPGAFLGDWLFRNLHQYLLPFTQQVGDRRLMPVATRLAAIAALLSLFSSFRSLTGFHWLRCRSTFWHRRGLHLGYLFNLFVLAVRRYFGIRVTCRCLLLVLA